MHVPCCITIMMSPFDMACYHENLEEPRLWILYLNWHWLLIGCSLVALRHYHIWKQKLATRVIYIWKAKVFRGMSTKFGWCIFTNSWNRKFAIYWFLSPRRVGLKGLIIKEIWTKGRPTSMSLMIALLQYERYEGYVPLEWRCPTTECPTTECPF